MISKTYIMIHNTEAIFQTTMLSVIFVLIITKLVASKIKEKSN